jgi:hypothetical protein
MKTLKSTAKMKNRICFTLLLCLGLFFSTKSFGATWYSVASGNWSVNTTWNSISGGGGSSGVPAAGDNVVIEGTYTVTVNAAESITNVQLGSAVGRGVLSFGAFTLTISGTLTIGGGGNIGSIDMTAGGTLSVKTSNISVVTPGTWTQGKGTVNLTGAGTVPNTFFGGVFKNLTINPT